MACNEELHNFVMEAFNGPPDHESQTILANYVADLFQPFSQDNASGIAPSIAPQPEIQAGPSKPVINNIDDWNKGTMLAYNP